MKLATIGSKGLLYVDIGFLLPTGITEIFTGGVIGINYLAE